MVNCGYYGRSYKESGRMDSRYDRANSWSNIVIGAAIEVHRLKGPGLLVREYLREVPLP
jgi:hypothetical protein